MKIGYSLHFLFVRQGPILKILLSSMICLKSDFKLYCLFLTERILLFSLTGSLI